MNTDRRSKLRRRPAPRVVAVLLVVLTFTVWRIGRTRVAADNARLPRPGTVVTDTMRSGGTAPVVVVIPDGSFLAADTGADSRAWMTTFTGTVPHRIAVARTETTVATFRRFVSATNVRIDNGCWYHTVQQQWRLNAEANWASPGFPQADDFPVTCMAYEDAQAYTVWLSAETNARYRLPTELEFEYFNRGGHAGAYSFGVPDARELCHETNGADRSAQFAYANACTDGYEFTSPVARFPANGFGLHDTTGNLWELTTDCWQSEYLRAAWHWAGFESRPLAGNCHGRHVVRGGSFISSPSNLQIAKREIEGYRSTRTGFRVVRELP